MDAEKSTNNEEIIQNLLEDFHKQRTALDGMIDDVESLKKDISKLFPEKLDKRFKHFFEEKVKTAVSMMNVLLDIRKELIKLTKDEIELRRKVQGKTGDINDLINVADIAKKVEKVQKKTEKTSDKIQTMSKKVSGDE